MRFHKLLVVGVAVLATGCMEQLLEARATRDLGCEDVHVTATYAGEYEASGCGDTVDYACIPGRYSATCIREGNLDSARPVVVVASPPPKTASVEPGFPIAAAVSTMQLAALDARDCATSDGPSGDGTAQVTFDPNGRVSDVSLSSPFANTDVGACISAKFRRVTLPKFAGDARVTKKSFEVPRAQNANDTAPRGVPIASQ